MAKTRRIQLQPVTSPEGAVNQVFKINSLVSDLMGIGDSSTDPIENIGVKEDNYHGPAARNIYRSLDTVQIIIDDPAEQALRHGFKISTNYDDDLLISKKLTERLKELKFNERCLQFLVASRLYSRGGLVVPVLKETNMDYGRGHLQKKLYLQNIERVQGLNIIREDFYDYHVQSYDPLGLNFDSIDWLNVQGVVLDPSRFFLSVLSLDPNKQRGVSILDRVSMACKALNVAEWTITNLLLRYRALLVKYPAQDVLNNTKEKKNGLVDLINDFKMKFTAKSVAALPDNYQFEYLQTSFAGLKEATEFLYEYLSTVSRIPQSIIKGSAMGQLASAEKDERTYQDYIKASEQEKKIKPFLEFLLPMLLHEKEGEIYSLLIQNGLHPSDIDIDIEFNPMLSVSPLQDSQRKLIDSQRVTGEIAGQLLTVDEGRQELHPTKEKLESFNDPEMSEGNPLDVFQQLGLNGGGQ